MKRKITYIISDVDRWQSFEWQADRLSKHYQMSFILINARQSYFELFLKKSGFETYCIRRGSTLTMPIIVFKVVIVLMRIRPSVIHCHFLFASITGLIAGSLCKISQRVYTRHHSVFHHRFHPKGVWYDKLANRLATDVVAISELVKRVLIQREHVEQSKVRLIHHGFDFDQIMAQEHGFREKFIREHGIAGKRPIIGVIARYIEWKGVQYVIPAFHDVLKVYPSACLVLLNARGPFIEPVKKLLSALPGDSYREIEFERNIQEVYRLFDVFVHAPIDKEVEAFGQVYVEALAHGVPSVFALSGVAPEFIVDAENAIIVPGKSSIAIATGVFEILKNNSLRERLASNGPTCTVKLFEIEGMVEKLRNLYDRKA
ncbi:MAG: glycosyltransferase family 4 protein [Imperialibacter sp.]|uniref:glycosyltransferase family 4 protein n=1 Tax=Imperialibacter sp. TaxID=2038411 RepID=UPI0032ECB211